MSGVRVFADTNLLVYSRGIDKDVRIEKSRHWLDVLAARSVLALNLQVLNEFTAVMSRKRLDLADAELFAICDQLAVFGVTPIQPGTTSLAREIRLSTRYAWWDCVLLASALELRCSHFLSEDLQDGHKLAGMTIVDPFKHSPEVIFGARN